MTPNGSGATGGPHASASARRPDASGKPLPPLTGRTALVTGASGGIGAAIAVAFGAAGARVAVHYHRNATRAAGVVDQVVAAGGHAFPVAADVTDGASVRAMVETTLARFGALDVLVNNAGILDRALVHEMSEEAWDRVIATNLRSVFLCSRAVLPHMLDRGRGVIINMSSTLAQKGITGHAHYAAAKGGIIAFTRALAREVGPKGIRVNAIAPGPIETDMIGPVNAEARRRGSALFALRRFGVPEDVAPTAVFLASDASSYYAGQTLCPNGGDVMP
jgi:3-oxoacyl-[acyl-carrier protein] reductase